MYNPTKFKRLLIVCCISKTVTQHFFKLMYEKEVVNPESSKDEYLIPSTNYMLLYSSCILAFSDSS